eukprot:355612-Amorphochlora_amoeboformis.AAC.1
MASGIWKGSDISLYLRIPEIVLNFQSPEYSLNTWGNKSFIARGECVGVDDTEDSRPSFW